MGRNHLCEQAIPEDPAHLLHKPFDPCRPSGLSFGFPKLFPSRRQLDYVLLARPPLYSPCGFRVRLACLIHAANVRSEPGSNPSLEKFILTCLSLHPADKCRQGGFAAAPTHDMTKGQTTQSHVAHLGQQPRSHTSLSRPPRMSKITHRDLSASSAGGRR